MGSAITLDVGKLNLAYAKNTIGEDFGFLFQPSDKRLVEYEYADETIERFAYANTLGNIKPRLQLAGYTTDSCKQMFECILATFEEDECKVDLNWDTFCRALQSVSLDCPQNRYDYFGVISELTSILISSVEFLPPLDELNLEHLILDEIVSQLDPLLLLRVFADFSKNDGKLVAWRYADLIDGGWIEESEIDSYVRKEGPGRKYLVLTEGSTDSDILRKSLRQIYPRIENFFDFIDMKDGYPFPGTGNLVKFCKGLVRIGIKRDIVVVLDNDTAGHAAFHELSALPLPSNFKVAILPSIPLLKNFSTLGPHGEVVANIDRRAAAIELYLDLNYRADAPPRVRWGSFHSKTGDYQGALEDKEKYIKRFHEYYRKDDYSLDNLKEVWMSIFKHCIDDEYWQEFLE